MAKRVQKKSKSRMRQTIYSITVALILVFFIAYALQSLYPSPRYVDYCAIQTKPLPDPLTQAQCVELGGTWNDWATPEAKGNSNSTGWCDMYTQCQKDFDLARVPYERNVFIINLV